MCNRAEAIRNCPQQPRTAVKGYGREGGPRSHLQPTQCQVLTILLHVGRSLAGRDFFAPDSWVAFHGREEVIVNERTGRGRSETEVAVENSGRRRTPRNRNQSARTGGKIAGRKVVPD